MQLTKIEQVKEGQTVFHPFYGKGIVDEISIFILYVSFNVNTPDQFCLAFWLEGKMKRSKEPYLISHLFTKPVYLCEKSFGMAKHFELDKDGQVTYYSFHPVNPEQ